jgi:hypothetical protein
MLNQRRAGGGGAAAAKRKGYGSSPSLSGTIRGNRPIGETVSLKGHHRRTTGWFIALVVLVAIVGLIALVGLGFDIAQVTLHHEHHPHQHLKPSHVCDDGNQCTVNTELEIGHDLACYYPPSPPGTECESICYAEGNHECNAEGTCIGDTCLGYCENDSDCPDIDFSKGIIWALANNGSGGAFGYDKFCYRNMCIYEHDSAVLPLSPSALDECTSAPVALAFADNLIDKSDPLSACLVPSVVCRGQYDDQVRVDAVFHTFGCSNASLPLFQFAGSTP